MTKGAYEKCVTWTRQCGKAHVKVDGHMWHLKRRETLFFEQFHIKIEDAR